MTSKEFIRYLKEKNCYNSWKKQTKKDIKYRIENGDILPCYEKGTNLKKFVEYFIKSNDGAAEIIMYSFKWTDTEEGSTFWNQCYRELKAIEKLGSHI